MSEGPVSKKVKVCAIPVHLLDLDGDLSVHITESRAMKHYFDNWITRPEHAQHIEERMERSHMSETEKTAIMEALYKDRMPTHGQVDFEEFLNECEDVCHYEVLYIKL